MEDCHAALQLLAHSFVELTRDGYSVLNSTAEVRSQYTCAAPLPGQKCHYLHLAHSICFLLSRFFSLLEGNKLLKWEVLI